MVVTCGHNAVRRVYCLASEMASHVFAKLSSAPPFRVRRVLSMIRHPGCASASVHLMHPAVYYAFRFSPLATSDVTRRRWRDGSDGPTSEVNTAYFSPDGTFVLSAAADKTAKLWCSHTGAPQGAHGCPLASRRTCFLILTQRFAAAFGAAKLA